MDDFERRYKAARMHRNEYIQAAGREVYKFCFNGREREWDERNSRETVPEEIFTDFPATVAEEFHGELFSTMTPENSPWVEYETGDVPEADQRDTVVKEITDFETAMAKAVRASNYYDEGQTAFQDAVVGTVAIWVDRPHLSSPLNVRAVPISKCYLRAGPRGMEDRFFRERYYYCDLPEVFPRATFSKQMQVKIDRSQSQADVVWGFWRDYADPANPQWMQGIRVDNEAIGMDKKLGPEGSCPMVVGRFNPIAQSAWGRGPGIRMLPTLRVLNELHRMNLEGMDHSLDPAYVYPHDGILNLSEGIESGMAYPAMPGSAESIRPLGVPQNLDYGFYSEERLQDLIRTGFYREAAQRGKTPPSASQYMGEDQKQIRRMARPAAPLWREFGIGFLRRVEWLERQAGGSLEGSKVPLIDSGQVIVRPISPLERAQAREDVLVAQQILQMTQQGLGPDQAGLLIDGPTTFRNIKTKLKDELVEFRTQDQLLKMAQQMQGIQAPQPGAPNGPQAPA